MIGQAISHYRITEKLGDDGMGIGNGGLILSKSLYNTSMQSEERLHLETIERLTKQSALLLRLYQAELARDPTSRATESSHSNLMALRHTIAQMYGDV